jgi:rhamnogalacturonyl hydrolase YesR
MANYNLLILYQHGFRRNHSTETASLIFTDTIRRGIDQGLLTEAVFVDLQKALDTIDHNVVIRKLTQIGVAHTELDWFKNYLKNRKQVVKVKKKLSQMSDISSGVPQGSSGILSDIDVRR